MNAPLIRPLLPNGIRWPAEAGETTHTHVGVGGQERRLGAAIETMMRGTAFLHDRAAIIEMRGTVSPPRHAWVLANALRELDCFLHVLLNELVACAGLCGPELRAFRRRRNAAGKLAAHPSIFGARPEDQASLAMLAAQRTGLLRISRGSGPLRAGVARDQAATKPMPSIDLKAISAFYADLSVRMVAHAGSFAFMRGQRRGDQAARPFPI